LQLAFVVTIIAQNIVEQDHGRMIDNLLVAAQKRLGAEVEKIDALLEVLKNTTALLGLKEVREELQAH
jgi:hypothetical protein